MIQNTNFSIIQENLIDDNNDINGFQNANQKLFNTMPALVLTAVQSFADDLEFDGTQFTNFKFMSEVQQVFGLLIKNVLKGLKNEDKNKTQLRLLLNDIDSELNDKIQEKIALSQAEKECFKILEDFDKDIVNAAKESLRDAIYKYMNCDWIFNHAINKQFRRDKNLKQIVLEKYLRNFRMELKKEEGVSIVVDRKKVLDIYSCIQEA